MKHIWIIECRLDGSDNWTPNVAFAGRPQSIFIGRDSARKEARLRFETNQYNHPSQKPRAYYRVSKYIPSYDPSRIA